MKVACPVWKSVTEACNFGIQPNNQGCMPRLWKSITEARNLGLQQNKQSSKPRLWKSIAGACNIGIQPGKSAPAVLRELHRICNRGMQLWHQQNSQSCTPRLWKSKTEACNSGLQLSSQSCKPRLWKSITEACNFGNQPERILRSGILPNTQFGQTSCASVALRASRVYIVPHNSGPSNCANTQTSPTRKWTAGARIPASNVRNAVRGEPARLHLH